MIKRFVIFTKKRYIILIAAFLHIIDFEMTRKFASFVRFSRLNTIMKRTLLLIYFTIIFITSVSAQLYQYLDTNDGLSSRRVLSIQKDNKGYMWFLTHEGIDRYNGKQYVHYSLSADGQPNMKSFPNLNTLEIDTAGVIWEIGKTDIF